MTEETKKKIIFSVCIFIALGFLTLLLSSITKNNNLSSSLETLNDDEKFYSIQSTINSEMNNENITYTMTKAVYKTHNNTDYYFISGYTLYFPQIGDVEYKGNVNYLLVLIGNTYNLYSIEENDIMEYAKKYDDYKPLENGKVLDIINYQEKNKIISYITNYINLSVFSENESYKYLKDKDNQKYIDISSNIISYQKNDNTYIVTDSKNNTFKIIENSTMDYLIEF